MKQTRRTIHEGVGPLLAAVSLGCALLGVPAGAATFTVNDAGDAGDGVCDGSCTLRDAVAAADAGGGADIIEITPGIDPVLTQAVQITITTEVTIRGQGAEQTTISGNGNSRIFAIPSSGIVTIEDVTFTGGRALDGNPGFPGGAIVNVGTLAINNSTLSGNRAGDAVGFDDGGGGGAIFNSGSANILDSVLSANRAGDAGISNGGIGGGGAISNSGTFTVTNSTLSGNAAGIGGSDPTPGPGGAGGAIRNTGSEDSTITATTIAGNTGRVGGAINMPDIEGTLTLTNTLLADNTDTGGGGNCFANDLDNDLIDGGGNLDDGDTCGFGPSSLSNADAGFDPDGPADNGGPTQTIALLMGSAAIDHGDDAACFEVDQRGVVRGIDGDGSDEDLDGGCDIGTFEAGGLGPAALAVDAGGNGVLEPGEAVGVAPTWRNLGAPPESLTSGAAPLVTGTASGLTGPGGASYELLDAEATYQAPPLGEITACQDAGDCHAVRITADGERPAPHWDASVVEILDAGPSTHTWTLHLGDSFTDVPRTHLFYRSIETVLHTGVTGGCTADEYCPAGENTRAQLPAFVLRALEGPDFTPTACVEGEETFADVPFDSLFCPWIEELAERGVVSGCGGDDYCPNAPVTRAQMAIFLLKSLLGGSYSPPGCGDVFDDVACPSLFADWIEDLSARGITSGCTETAYCPNTPVNRGQMAVFVARTFGLSLYGP